MKWLVSAVRRQSFEDRKRNGPNPDLWPKAVARVPALEFRRAPLLTAVCWFALGEVMARNRQPAIVLLIATLLLSLLTLAALRWSLRMAIVPLAAVWMAIGCWCAEIQPAPPTQHALASYADGLSRQLRGRVMRVRELSPQQNDSDHDKETGWWPEKEADEEAAAVGALSVDIQVDSIEEVTPDISRMVPDDWRRADECDRRQASAIVASKYGCRSRRFASSEMRRRCGSPDADQARRSGIATPERGSMRTTFSRKA